MSVTSCGSFRHGTSGWSCGKRNSGTRYEMEHDIYAAYSEDDQSDVLHVLDILKRNQLTVYDPHLDALPSQTIFKAWLEHGIYMSKITVVFLTKKFISHNYCRYQADNAVNRYAKTKGRHRVIVIMLQSCKIPKNLQHFHCVYAWKFRQNPEEQYTRILKAIFAPRDKFRRGSVLWANVNRNTAQLANKRISELSIFNHADKNVKSLLNYASLVFNLSKVKLALENCELKCTSENCRFQCSGDKIIEKFFTHIKICKYQHVKCRFCRQTTLRKNLSRHEQTTCKRRHIKCPNDSCGKMLAATEMYNHARVCSYKIVGCSNEVYGCNGIFARKDKAKHLEICEYEKVTCKSCESVMFRIDIETHKCERCEIVDCDCLEDGVTSHRADEMFKCYFSGCNYTGFRYALQTHLLSCEYRREQCPDCGMRLCHRDLVWHRKNCDKIIECEHCHQLVPSSSKLTHDRWICNGQNVQMLCDICHISVSNGRKEIHTRTCLTDHRLSQTEMNAVSSTGNVTSLPVQSRKHPIETHSLPEVGGSSTGEGNHCVGVSGQEQPKSRVSPSFERLLYEVIPDGSKQSRERSYSDYESVPSQSSFSFSHKWTPSKRKQWQDLMQQIDNNKAGLRIAMSNC